MHSESGERLLFHIAHPLLILDFHRVGAVDSGVEWGLHGLHCGVWPPCSTKSTHRPQSLSLTINDFLRSISYSVLWNKEHGWVWNLRPDQQVEGSCRVMAVGQLEAIVLFGETTTIMVMWVEVSILRVVTVRGAGAVVTRAQSRTKQPSLSIDFPIRRYDQRCSK